MKRLIAALANIVEAGELIDFNELKKLNLQKDKALKENKDQQKTKDLEELYHVRGIDSLLDNKYNGDRAIRLLLNKRITELRDRLKNS